MYGSETNRVAHHPSLLVSTGAPLRSAAADHFAESIEHGTLDIQGPWGEVHYSTASRTAVEGMRTLDSHLYGWLNEPDQRSFTIAFNAYYAAAYPALLRRLARLSRWDLAELEEIAQDALFKFFDAARMRHDFSNNIRSRLDDVRPLNLGDLHRRRVKDWSRDLEVFRNAVMSFRPTLIDAGIKDELRTLAAAIPQLQHRGWRLLEEVHHAVAVQGCAITAAATEGLELEDRLRQFATDLRTENETAEVAETRLRGCRLFVHGVHDVTAKLPMIRIPTSALLFEIALTLYVDECRRRGRLKRGGPIGATPSTNAPSGDACIGALYEAVALSSEVESAYGEEPVGYSTDVQIDETTRIEQQDVLEKFYAYLREPLDRALERCTREPASRAAEQRAGKLTRKFDLMMDILARIGEGHSQVEIAQLLGLSRNQVKYVVESVQQAYAAFVSGGASDAASIALAEG
jgi:DNA-directed RNA polymerase specialized sigma24 family protein